MPEMMYTMNEFNPGMMGNFFASEEVNKKLIVELERFVEPDLAIKITGLLKDTQMWTGFAVFDSTLPRVNPGDLITAHDINRIIDKVNELNQSVATLNAAVKKLQG